MHSPVKLRHAIASENLFTLLKVFVRKHDLGSVFHEKILIVLNRNDYEPDICFFPSETAATFTPAQSKFPAPDLIVEVLSESTEANDRGIKFEDYAAHGVAEYWIVDPVAETIEQYLLQEGVYRLAVKVKTGTVASTGVTGFEIPVPRGLRRCGTARRAAGDPGWVKRVGCELSAPHQRTAKHQASRFSFWR